VRAGATGAPLAPDLFTKSFKRLAASAGLDPKTGLHDLRHGVATQLGRAGVHPHTVSTVMGRSSVAFTMDVYTEDWDEGTDLAASALDNAVHL
jgi:integrase